MRFLTFTDRWPRWKRCLLTGLLLAGLAAAAFYAEENWRGSRAMDQAIGEADQARVPRTTESVYAPRPPDSRNLFYSPAFQNRILWPEGEQGLVSPQALRFPAAIPWGLELPKSVSDTSHSTTGKSGRNAQVQVAPDPREGKPVNFAWIRDSLLQRGLSVSGTGSPAGQVRTALDRHEVELREWSTAVRERPEWAPAHEHHGSLKVFDELLRETALLYCIRAMSSAASGRDGAEVVDDLETAVLLGTKAWQGLYPLGGTVWEILRTRRLNDAQLARLGALLPDQPVTAVLLKYSQAETLQHLGKRATYWENYYMPWDGPGLSGLLHQWLKPSGWYEIEDAWMTRIMIANQHRVRQIESTWATGIYQEPPPRVDPGRPFEAGSNVRPFNDLSYHLQSCGCPFDSIEGKAITSRIAMVAAGLERYRLQHGSWPETLQAAAGLVPRGLRPIPVKPGGSQMEYTRTPDGGWQLHEPVHGLTWLMPGSP